MLLTPKDIQRDPFCELQLLPFHYITKPISCSCTYMMFNPYSDSCFSSSNRSFPFALPLPLHIRVITVVLLQRIKQTGSHVARGNKTFFLPETRCYEAWSIFYIKLQTALIMSTQSQWWGFTFVVIIPFLCPSPGKWFEIGKYSAKDK